MSETTESRASPRVVVITGAASGIGKATALEFKAENARLVLLDRDVAVERLAQEIDARAIVLDLASEQDIKVACAQILSEFGRVDVLVNNAGIHPRHDGGKAPLHLTSTTEWQNVLAINLTAPFLMYRELFEGLKRSGSARIINVSSRAGRTISPTAAGHYSASKAGITGLTRVMAQEGAPYGMTANAVAPGPVVTGLTVNSSGDVRAELARSVPAGRYGAPEELAAAILFLASPKATYVTGATLDVNGGSFMAS